MQKKRLQYASVTSLPFLPCAVKGILAVNLPAKGKQRFSHKPLANVNLRRRRLIPSMDKRRKEGGGGVRLRLLRRLVCLSKQAF